MQIVVAQEQLKRGIAIVQPVVPGKPALPVLGHILFTATNGTLTLSATNLEVGITHRVAAQVHGEGAVTLPAKLLGDVIAGLPNEPVTLTCDPRNQAVTVTCARFTSTIKGMDGDEFPVIPRRAEQTPTLRLPAAELQRTIAQVAGAAATDDSRPVLAGVLMRLRDGCLTFAAADGFRLASHRRAFTEQQQAVEVIIPARALEQIGRIAGLTDGEVTLVVSPNGNQITCTNESTSVVSRLIDGRFPDFERIIPQQYTTRSVIDTAALKQAVKLASYFASASQNSVRLTMEPGEHGGRLVISANAVEVGDNTGEVDATMSGESGQIALNVTYLQEALTAITTAQVVIETQSPNAPAVLKPFGAEGSYVHIIMPMSLR